MTPPTTPRRRRPAGVLGLAGLLLVGVADMVLAVFPAGCTTAAASGSLPPPAGLYSFEQYEVVTGFGQHQTVLTGFLLRSAVADLAVLSIDPDGARRLRIHALHGGTWTPRLDTTLRSGVTFVDVADIGGRDRLITYERGRLSVFEPESATERALVTVSSDIPAPRRGGIPHVDVTRDVNADGRDDLVVPDSDGFWVYIQRSGGAFAEPVQIGPSFDMDQLYGQSGYRQHPWDQSRVHELDYDRDGRRDLVFWDEGHFAVHVQDEQGLFLPAAGTFTTDVAFDSDDLAWLVAPDGVRGRRLDHGAPGAMTGKVLHSMADMNGDGVADLGIFALHGGSSRLLGQTSELWSMRSTYEVHFGAPAPGGTVFAAEAGAVVESDGIPFELGQHDFDQDGQVDMLLAVIDPGIFKAIGLLVGAVLTDSFTLDLELYRMDGGRYPAEPTDTRKIKAHSPGESGQQAMHFPAMLIGDVNGDGHADLLVQHGLDELRVHLGVPGPDLFARRPHELAIAMTGGESTWLVDLNQDGKQDVVMHHPSSTEPHRVSMLIAR